MERAMTVNDILEKKYRTFPMSGRWEDFIGHPERKGVWFIWGKSGNGKTSFAMQLIKELCQWDRVLMDSLEEGTSLTVQQNLKRYGMKSVGRRLQFVCEDIDSLRDRLHRRKSPNIVVIDSFQYTYMTAREYKNFSKEFEDKLLIFISHASGSLPLGGAAVSAMYDATLKIEVSGYRATTKGRFIGRLGYYDIWPEKAKEFHENS